ncbi:MAG: translation initiation factor [Saprospiraceae bacterium]|nr:translation initiation factor [Saprospiraceae bacterium]
MSKKSKKIKGGGLVYSTNKETMEDLFSGINVGSNSTGDTENEKDQKGFEYTSTDKVRIWIDRKSRGGKEVTIIQGISADVDSLKELATKIKTKCGVGGSVKDLEIIIQGNQRDKVIEILQKEGFKDVKKAGG